jgi:hypothetical protein
MTGLSPVRSGLGSGGLEVCGADFRTCAAPNAEPPGDSAAGPSTAFAAAAIPIAEARGRSHPEVSALVEPASSAEGDTPAALKRAAVAAFAS